MRKLRGMRKGIANACLLLVAGVVGLALCEGSLRLFYPKYRALAEAQFHFDAMRIWARTPHQRDFRYHPDTGAPHFVYYNNLGLRQHRNFSAADLAAAVNVGVFGDSFTENTGMAVPYSFTEPLDYLLNRGQQRFNVLNFGVDGYGPGQSLLHYEHFRYAADLDHVLYVYCRNDLRNIYATGLFHLDAAGQLVRNEAIRESWWGPFMRRWHLSYLVLDVRQRWPAVHAETTAISEHLERGRAERLRDERHLALYGAIRQGRLDQDDLKHSLRIFRQLIRRWKHLVEHTGGTFSVVLLPSHPPQPFVVELLTAEGVEVIDLYACFRDADPAHPQRPWDGSFYRFKHDEHWNETGNRLAAVCLYRVLEARTGRPKWSEEKLQDTLFQYYAAFGGERFLKAGAAGSGAPETAAAIRRKYLAWGGSDTLRKRHRERVRKALTTPEKRMIRSVFDVYLDGRWLIYLNENCRSPDTQARFFLHIIPVDRGDLSASRVEHGFDNRDFSRPCFKIDDKTYAIMHLLPAYAIRHIRTGQFVTDAQGNFVHLWEGEFFVGRGAGVEGAGLEPRRAQG